MSSFNEESNSVRYSVQILRGKIAVHGSFKTACLEHGLPVILSEARRYVEYLRKMGLDGQYTITAFDNRENDLSKRVLSSEVIRVDASAVRDDDKSSSPPSRCRWNI